MSRKTAHGGNRQEIMAQYGLSELVDFSANLNPLGAPPEIKELLVDNLTLIEEYPPEYPEHLEKVLANWHGTSPENIIVGNGSTEIIYLLPYIPVDSKAVIITPTFTEYEQACQAAGQKLIFWPTKSENNFICNWDKLLKHHGQEMGLLFLASPNNPTGKLLPKPGLLYLLEKAKEYNFLLIVDEAFLEFVENSEQHTLIEKTKTSKHLVVLRSLTKIYAIPGLRLGYAIGHPSLISRLRAIQAPWSVNSLAQAVGKKLVELQPYQEKTRSLVKTQRKILYQALLKHPFFEPYPGAANYLLVKIVQPSLTADKLQEKLIRRGYLIRNCANFQGLDDTYFRIAVRTLAENQGFISTLEDITSEIS